MTQTQRSGPNAALAPTSLAQERLWLVDQITPGSNMYNLGGALELHGRLHADRLGAALNDCIARHETLRTCFTPHDGVPHQVILSGATVPLPVVDVEELAGGLPGAEVRSLVRELADQQNRAFDLRRAPLLRAALIRLGPTRHVLVVVVHHIVSDFWSQELFLAELGLHYNARAAGRPAGLPELPAQYADYAAHQRDQVRRGELADQLAYWRRQLADLPTLRLPTDRPRPPVESHRGARYSTRIDARLAGRLRRLAVAEGVSLYMALLAGFAATLARFSGQDDIVVGTPMANRARPEVQAMVGLFVNMLTMRTRLPAASSLRAALRATARTCLDAYDHQDAPFDQVVRENRDGPDPSRQPLFQVAFQVLDDTGEMSLDGLTVVPIETPETTVKWDISAVVTDLGDGLDLDLQYAADLWDAATIERFARSYRRMLTALADDPDQRLDAVPLLTGAEQRRIVHGRNDTARPLPADATLDALFAARAAATPDAVALVDAAGEHTYRWLAARSNRIAHALHAAGVGADAVVGVALPRSVEQVAAMLGVVQAGAGYLVLDAGYPAERLQHLAADAGLAAVLAARPERPAYLPDSVPLVALSELDGGTDQAPPRRSHPDGLANVVYTSGSTGTPKGVGITHRGVVRLVASPPRRGRPDAIRIAADDVLLHTANPSFDTTTFLVWGALLNGARLVVLPADRPLTGDDVRTAIDRYGATLVRLTPALVHQLVDADPATFAGLRQLIVGGDVLDPARVRRMLTHGRPERLVNAYGPTEVTVTATAWRVDRTIDAASSVPIGAPIPNTTAYVLDARLRPVPVGVYGELCVGGPGVARGYLGRPGATADRFVPDPYGPAGGRLYRTGDRARWLPGDVLEFAGRADRQLKIRGHRIEPGEVEAALRAIDGVGDCVVLDREHAGDRHLVGYVAGVGGRRPDAAAVRARLADALPPYLVPDHLIPLDALPLTATNKVDLRALPTTYDPIADATERRAPETPLQQRLHDIWTEFLGVDRVGVDDNFFLVGGHSLLATSVALAIAERLGVDLPVLRLFQRPTIAGLAADLAERGVPMGDPAAVPPPTVGDGVDGHAGTVTTPADGEIVPGSASAGTVSVPADVGVPVVPGDVGVPGVPGDVGVPGVPGGAGVPGVPGDVGPGDRDLLVALRDGRGAPLICLPGAGGDAVDYADLAAALADRGPVYGIRPAGRDTVDPACGIGEIAAGYLDLVRARWPHGPYRLLGWSMGGVVAVELATRLAADGAQVSVRLIDAHLPADPPAPATAPGPDADPLVDTTPVAAVSESRAGDSVDGAPGTGETGAPAEPGAVLDRATAAATDDARALAAFAEQLHATTGIQVDPAAIGGSFDAAVAELFARAAAAGFVPTEAQRRHHRGRILLYRNHLTALRTHRPAAPCPVPVQLVQLDDADPAARATAARRWAAICTGEFRVCRVPGAHHTVLHPPYVAALASALASEPGAAATPQRQYGSFTGGGDRR